MSFRRDTRGVSVAVTHALTLGITAILITALMIGAGSLLDEQRERVAREQLQDIGGSFAEKIHHLDKLDDDSISGSGAAVNTTLPPSVGGLQYTLNIKAEDYAGGPDKESVLYLNTTDAPYVSVTIPVSNDTWVDTRRGVKTDELAMRLCQGSGSPYSPSGQLLVFGRECP